MLKVVGASWYQKRISTYILVGSGMLVVAAFFIAEMERPQLDGTYCATVYWSKNYGFKIEYWKQRLDLENIPKGVARTCYKDSINENGWSQIEIETQRMYPDWVQAFGAGLLEGSLTWNKIYNQWTNTISSACDRDENSQNFCTWLRDILSSNYHSIKELLKKRSVHDHYWHQINLFYYQLEGIESGWRNGAKRARSDLENAIPFEDFLLMNAAADIHDLKIYFENFIMHESNNENIEKNFLIPSATMLMKLKCTSNNNNEDDDNNNNSNSTDKNENEWNLFFGHSSAGSYSSMLRLQKRYKFHYHFTNDQKTNTIPGTDIIFTGYPGILSSIDDFYLIKGRHIYSLIAGVALKNHNIKLWNSIDINQLIPLSARVMAANRLSQSRRTWAKAMSRHPSTGSKQWIIIDLKKLNILKISSLQHSIINDSNDIGYSGDDDSVQDHKNSKGIVWVVEQLPGRLHAEDMTNEIMNNNDNMNNNCLWFANGTPYFNEILDASKITSNDNDDDRIDKSAIMKQKMNITSLDDIEQILYKYSFRGDLLGEQSIPYGNIDMKLFAYSVEMNKGILNTIAGPLYAKKHHYQQSYKSNKITNNNRKLIMTENDLKNIEKNYEIDKNEYAEQERRTARNDIRALNTIQYSRKPFKWSKVDNSISDVKHEGHPDEWNFDKISPKWAWHD